MSIFQEKKQDLPWSFKTKVRFVLDLNPVKAGTGQTVDAEVANEM